MNFSIANDRNGGIAVPLAIIFPILIGFTALAIERGLWQIKSSELQTLADTSAYSVVVSESELGKLDIENILKEVSSLSEVADDYKNLACATGHFQSAGLQIGLKFGSRTLCYSSPPQLGAHAGDDSYVEVTLAETVPRTLSKIYDNTDVVIRERVVVRASKTTRVCALSLSEIGNGFIVQGSTEVNVSGCSLASNSKSSDSFVVKGSKVSVSAGCIDTVGGFSSSGNPILDLECDAIRQNQPPIVDPFQDILFPDQSNCVTPALSGDGRYQTVTNGSICFSGDKKTTSLPLSSGFTEFDEGVYFLKDLDFKITSNDIVNGLNVTFVLLGSSMLQISGGAEIRLTASTIGPYKGLLFASPNGVPNATHNITGGGSLDLDGSIYFPSQDLELTGNSGTLTSCLGMIANKIIFSGNQTLNFGCPPIGPTAYTRKRVGLVE